MWREAGLSSEQKSHHRTFLLHLLDVHSCTSLTRSAVVTQVTRHVAQAHGPLLALDLGALGCRYLPSSGIALENRACCSVRCFSISSSFSWKCWQELFITSISWRVHYTKKQEDTPLYYFSLSTSMSNAFEADSLNGLGPPLTPTTGTLSAAAMKVQMALQVSLLWVHPLHPSPHLLS